MSQQIIFVLAGNYQQFRYWKQHNRDKYPSETRLEPLTHLEQIYGLRGGDTVGVIEIGTFRQREDAQRIRDWLRTHEFVIEKENT
jgi:hypothetical protein